VYAPLEVRRIAVSSAPVVIWPASADASLAGIWSLPPRTWYF
jgi:hypothetical protein